MSSRPSRQCIRGFSSVIRYGVIVENYPIDKGKEGTIRQQQAQTMPPTSTARIADTNQASLFNTV